MCLCLAYSKLCSLEKAVVLNQGWPCPFASSPLAIEKSTWLRKSASDEFSGEDTNQLSDNTPVGVP